MSIGSYPPLPQRAFTEADLPTVPDPDTPPQPVASGTAAAALAQVRAALDAVCDLPGSCHQLDEHELIATTQVLLALMQRCEASVIACTTNALDRDVIARSTAAGAKQWITRLAAGHALHTLTATKPSRTSNGNGGDDRRGNGKGGRAGGTDSGPLIRYPDPADTDPTDTDPTSAGQADINPDMQSSGVGEADPWDETADRLADAADVAACVDSPKQDTSDPEDTGHETDSHGGTEQRASVGDESLDGDGGVDVVAQARARATGQVPRQPGLPVVPGVEGAVAHRIATLATQFRDRRNHRITHQVHTGVVSPATARVALTHVDQIADLIPACTRDQAIEHLLTGAVDATTADMRRLIAYIVAVYGGPEALDERTKTQDRHETLTWHDLPNGMVELIATLSREHAASITHAIQSLSAPGRYPYTTSSTGRSDDDDASSSGNTDDSSGDAGESGNTDDSRHNDGDRNDETDDPTSSDDNTDDSSGDDDGASGGAQRAADTGPPDWAVDDTDRSEPEPEPSWCGTAESATTTPPADTRTPGKRRADAFIDLIHIAARAIDEGHLHPGGTTARVVITLNHEVLLGQLAATTCPHCTRNTESTTSADGADRSATHGTFTPEEDAPAGNVGRTGPSQPPAPLWAALTENGDILPPETARHLACDASIVPIVLGTNSIPLDVGTQRRLFTRELRQAIITRDAHCTFPGCDRPPSFTQAHHILPWWCGGATSLDNATLLCQRHHSIVHRDRYMADLTNGHITWDLDHPGRMPLIPAHHPGPPTP